MIRLYTAATPNGHKASIGLEELDLDYEVHRIDLSAGEQRSDGFLAINPNHMIPALEDDGLTLWESGAILLHLAEKYGRGKLISEDPARRIEAIQYAFFQTGGVGPNFGRLGEALRRPEGERNDEMVQIFAGETGRLMGVLDRILADGRDYLAGDYSIGDIMHYPWLKIAHDLAMPALLEQPRVVAWLERIGKRPAVQKGMQIPA